MPLKSGKVPERILRTIIERLPIYDIVVEGPSYGVDAAVVDMGTKYMVVTSDPITFVGEDVGYYLVHINANDVASMGGTPEILVVDVLLEDGCDEDVPLSIMGEIGSVARELGISVVGGHTEVTPGLDRTIVVGTMLGFTEGKKYFHPKFIKEGDLLVLTKGIAIEGTSIIVREKKDEGRRLLGEGYEKAYNFIHEPGISVLKDAKIAGRVEGVHAMHDPTEGGLAQGIREMLSYNGLGALIYYDRIPIYRETLLLSEYFGLNPLGLIASGALLIAVREDSVESLMEEFKNEGVRAEIIGVVKSGDFGIMLEKDGRREPLPEFESDEITKIFDG